MAISGYSLSTITQFVGQELGVSAWMTIDQERRATWQKMCTR